MAASAPHSKEWNEGPGRSSGDPLELGMSGLSLVSNVPGSNSRPPALSGSDVSSAPEDHHHRQHSFGSISFPNSDLHNTHGGSGPPSPSSPMARGVIGNFSQHFTGKPPGLSSGSLPSPIGKSFVNSLSSSPTVNFSPPSSVADGLGFSNHNSPWANLANVAYSHGDRDADSFDRSEDPDDGLMGLGALRERAHSSPGPIFQHNLSSSPPVRIDVHQYQGDLSPLPSDGERGRPPDPRRIRHHSFKGGSGGSRPPLSGHPVNQAFSDSSFVSFGGRGSPGSNDISFDYSSGQGRSDLAERLGGHTRSFTLGSMSDHHLYDMNRNAHNEQYRPNQYQYHIDQSHTQKFGSLPSLTNIHQRAQTQQLPPHGNRHNRSFSHSGAILQQGIQDMHDDGGRRMSEQLHGGLHHHRLHSDGGSDGMFSSGNDGIYSRLPGVSNLHRSMSSGDYNSARSAPTGGVMQLQRSVSMSQAIMSQGFENQPVQRRNSDQLLGGNHFGGSQMSRQNMHPSMQRRDEYNGDATGAPIMATPEEMRAFNIPDDRLRSSYHNVQSSIPRRSSSDFKSLGMHNGNHYVVQNQDLHGFNHGGMDDDLTHPLAGEHIDDPDDYGFNNSLIHGNRQAAHAPHVRTSHATHSARAPPAYGMQLAGGSSIAVNQVVYTVKFKRTQRNFVVGPRMMQDLKVGCYVKVEADRGEDLGIVVGKVPAEKFSAAGRSSFGPGTPSSVTDMMGTPLSPSGVSDLKRIVRLATQDEVGLLAVKRDEEEDLLNICRQKVRQRALPMHVVDAEYQFDRHKLTFFFEAEGRIDFRELVRDLFSIYKTRIWMQQLDKNVPGNGPPATTAIVVQAHDYSNQVPVMADNMNDPYGISS